MPKGPGSFGAAQAHRQRPAIVRFKVFDAGHQALVAESRNAIGDGGFAAAWAEGAALSTEEAIAYALRGRGERKRPPTGWESLTPTEFDVVRLVEEGLPNKDIATRLFVSPRTVQSHLRHVYNKLSLTSRVQLAQEAAAEMEFPSPVDGDNDREFHSADLAVGQPAAAATEHVRQPRCRSSPVG